MVAWSLLEGVIAPLLLSLSLHSQKRSHCFPFSLHYLLFHCLFFRSLPGHAVSVSGSLLCFVLGPLQAQLHLTRVLLHSIDIDRASLCVPEFVPLYCIFIFLCTHPLSVHVPHLSPLFPPYLLQPWLSDSFFTREISSGLFGGLRLSPLCIVYSSNCAVSQIYSLLSHNLPESLHVGVRFLRPVFDAVIYFQKVTLIQASKILNNRFMLWKWQIKSLTSVKLADIEDETT